MEAKDWKPLDGISDVWMDGWIWLVGETMDLIGGIMNEWMDGWMDGGMNEWVSEWVDGRTNVG